MQVTMQTKIAVGIILVLSVLFVSLLYIVPMAKLSKYDYIELNIDENIKSIDISDYKIKVEYLSGISKAILNGVIVSDKGDKIDIIFYPDSNTFRFDEGSIRYRICSDEFVAYK